MKHHFFAPYKKPLTYIILLIVIGGGFTYSKLHKSLFPQITFPKIGIIANNGEQPAHKMMVTVTKPLEVAIKKVPGMQMIRSRTSRGSTQLSAFFSWNSNMISSQQLIESQISQIRNQLPSKTQITIRRMNPSAEPVIGFLLKGKNKNLIQLTQIAKNTIRPFLAQLKGVAQIQIQGSKPKQYWATLKPKAMSRLGITPAKIKSAISKTGFIQSNGYATGYRRLYLTLTNASAHSLKDMRNLVISNNGKRTISLGDVASLSVHPQIKYVRVSANGHQGVLVNIIKHPGKNLVNLSEQIKNKMPQLQKLLPHGVKMSRYYDQATFVGVSVHDAIRAIWIGLLFAIIITVLFLRSFRSSITMLLTIPTTIALTLIVLYVVGYNLNLMTLGAIAAAIGLIIDDAIIVVEQIHRMWEEHPDEPPSVNVRRAINYLFPALVGSSLSTIVIFLPFSLMGGVAGAYFKVLAYTMVITLACSFFVVWLGLPVIYMWMASLGKLKQHEASRTEPAQWSKFLSSHPSIAFIFVIIIVALTILVMPHLPSGFLPHMDEGMIVLDYNAPPGSSLDETNQILHRVDKIIRTIPTVANFSRRTGTQLGFFITEPNNGDYLIQLKKNRSKSTSQVINELRSKITKRVPSLRVDFGQVISDELGDLTQSVQPIKIKIFGSDPKVLHKYAKKVANLMRNVRGTADVFDGMVPAGPSFSIRPNARALARYHMTPADLRLQLQTHFQGIRLAGILEQERVAPLQMIYPDRLRKNISSIRKAEILLPNGKRKPLTALAKVRVNKGSYEIDRENLQTLDPVTSRLENRSLGKTVQAIQKKINEKISLPHGYRISYGGAYAQQQKSFHQLLIILLASSLLVFTVSLFLFTSIGASIVIYLTSIIGMTGSILALYLTGTPLDVSSYTGIIMIVGIIAENAIFTYYRFRQSYEAENMSLDDAVAHAIALRVRPNLMTVTSAVAALMPLALATGFHKPLAIAVIGGFIVALPLLLVVLPAFIRILYSFSETE
ncbi:MAG TPA: efflux RND transporter permease subunit [Balneolaceae bacterium]|nr:efflux RND transporter permease subunit [Balneolaceae bacterium]